MSDTPDPTSEAGTQRPSSSTARTAVWFAAALAVTGLAGFATVHLLARTSKPILLTALGFGLVAGWILAQLARRLAVAAPRRRSTLLAAIAIAVGLVVLTLESHRLYAAAERANFAHDPTAIVAAQLHSRGDVPDDVTESFAAAAAERRQVLAKRTSFAGYLDWRAKALGDWPRPWPAVLWALEVVMGSLAGTWVFARGRPTVAGESSHPLS